MHVRCVSGGIRDLRTVLDDVYDALRPGGILLYIDGAPLVDEHYNELTVDGENASVSTFNLGRDDFTNPGTRAFHGWRR